MKIRRILSNSLIDYPNKIASVIFLGGCNFDCNFCFVPELLKDEGDDISKETVLKFLENRKAFIDAVVITGGEPTINADLPEFIYRIKSLGFDVRLYTNGSNPKMLRELISEKMIDSIAVDIKGKLDGDDYERIAKNDCATLVKESIYLISQSDIEKEFRVVMIPGRTEDDIKEIEKYTGPVRRMKYLKGV